MIKSMTGYGKLNKENTVGNIQIEIRSLNSKSADINLRIPSSYRAYELDLRNEITKYLERGKIDLSIYIEQQINESPIEINTTLALTYHAQLKNLAKNLGENSESLLKEIIKMPDVIKHEKKEADESNWKEILGSVKEAMVLLDNFRKEEGKSIEKDFVQRITVLENHLEEISKLDQNRITRLKERIKGNLSEIIANGKLDENRFEQELIYYIEKIDINEEKVRLKQHLNYFKDTMNENSSGRKLSFIAQEIGREINTIGSKANDAPIQKIVVQMKDELEKIKEQCNNVL